MDKTISKARLKEVIKEIESEMNNQPARFGATLRYALHILNRIDEITNEVARELPIRSSSRH